MKKIQSGQGASDFGTLEKKAESEMQEPLADWEKQILDQADLLDDQAVALSEEMKFATSGSSTTLNLDASALTSWSEPTAVPLTEKWVTDVIYEHWWLNRDEPGFPHWIANAAEIIVAGR